jgi:hypothetical protein
VNQIDQVVFAVGRSCPEENHIGAANDRHRAVVRGDVDQQPVAWLCVARLGTDHRIHQVHGRKVDDAGVRAGRLARALVRFDNVAARDRHHVLTAAVGQRDARDPGDLRVLDPERHRLPNLPAD